VHQIAQAAEALLVEKDPLKAASEQETDTSLWTPRNSKRRRSNVSDRPTTARQRLPSPPIEPVEYVPAARSSAQMADLIPGTTRAGVRQLLGDPDVTMYKLEKDHEVENFVYVDRQQSSATTVLLLDGRVVSVDTGTPVVRASHSDQER